MGAPKINISFIEQAKTLIKRSDRGIVALVLKQSLSSGQSATFTVKYEDDIPSYLSAFNKEQIQLCLLGNETAPKKIECYIMDTSDTEATTETLYTAAKAWIQKTTLHFLAIPTVNTDGQLSNMVTFVKNEFNTNKHKFLSVFPFAATSQDSECIIGCEFTAYTKESTSTATSGTYTAEEYCSRIAGFIAGTPFTQSITYGTLKDLSDCNRLSTSEQDTAVDAGKLILMNDGEKVKIVRGVNTLVTTTTTKGASFKKIKIVNIMCMIYDDLITMIRDQYIGKFNNDYDNKCNLVIAINSYFNVLVTESIITSGSAEIDAEAIRKYLIQNGTDITNMTDQEILESNTGSLVYLTGKLGIPDAIEDVEFPIYL